MTVIDVRGLRKTYRSLNGRRHTALDGLDLLVDPADGAVHGFLGPNGSGKTTTLRVLLGLVRADSGSVLLFDEPVPSRLHTVVSRVGSIVESPQFFANFTGRRNLELLAGVGGIPRSRVDEVLDKVGLHGRGDDRVKGYSLGMRQRLAIAGALLKQPQLLILDEPTNGLDPAGIREIRDLVRQLGEAGVTVLLSSHLLSEVQAVCDAVTIVTRGRTITSGRVADVMASVGVTGRVRVGLTDLTAGGQALQSAGYAVTAAGGHLFISGAQDPAEITRVLASHGLYVNELLAERADLEEAFLTLTAEADPGAPPGGFTEAVLPQQTGVVA
ncbi:MAG: transporter [Frankiales bacterium]|nr:transporter [Frankiales bacterium]